MQRLRKNTGGYFGERIDIEALLPEITTAAAARGWLAEVLPTADGPKLPVLRRSAAKASRRWYVSAGIHGDEPAGPLAVRQLILADLWPADADISILPCLNPWGFAHNARFNAQGIDLNRDYRHGQSGEVRVHLQWLQHQPRFDLTVCLHEDWEAEGFYVYELLAPDRPSIAAEVVTQVSAVCPIDRSAQIDGWPARDGVIQPPILVDERPQWPEAVYLFRHHTGQAVTLEAPSDFPLETRVAALVAGTRAALAAAARQ